jgi:HD-like signal output (HDOD) protein/CheY-like chemotaxis protein
MQSEMQQQGGTGAPVEFEAALRVLVAGGERAALENLRRQLRGSRRGWETSCALGGNEALELAGAQPFDVVIADLRLPGMTGIELLGRVQQRHPQAARILTCAYDEASALLRGLPVAHYLLTKPFDAAGFLEAIERATAIRGLLQNERAARVIGRIGTLPVRPDVHAQIRRLLLQSDWSLDALTGLVERDPALCGRLLRLVNSGLFGFPERITSIRTAITYVGATMLEHLALATGVSELMRAAPAPKGFSIDAEIERAVRTGHAAAAIADRRLRDEAFIAGLMHDVGRILLASRVPDLFERACAEAERLGIPLPEAERAVAGGSHAEIGGYLAGLWDLPSAVVEAIGFHHAPSESSARSFGVIGAVHVASALVGGPDGTAGHAIDERFVARLGIDGELPRWREAVGRITSES